MKQHTHDPREQIRGIHQILISKEKRIGFLFGAGSSFATNSSLASVPAIEKMTETIVGEVGAKSPAFSAAIKEMQTEIELAKIAFNIESLLSSIEAKRAVIGSGQLNGLDAAAFSELATLVKSQVVKLVSVHDSLKQPEERKKLSHARLANWVQKARRRFPTLKADRATPEDLIVAGDPATLKSNQYPVAGLGSSAPFLNTKAKGILGFLDGIRYCQAVDLRS